MRRARPLNDPHRQLKRLEERHRALDDQVSELDAQSYLSPSDHLRRQELKKKKLATKDALGHVRASIPPGER